MLFGLRQGKYVIDAILRESGDICIYTAHNKKKQRFVVNEIRGIGLIDRWLPELSPAAHSEGLECFTENSYLYVVTHYYDGDKAASYFSIVRPETGVKLKMLGQFIFRQIELSEYPDVIVCGMLLPESVCVLRGEVCQNCYISIPEKAPMELLYELLHSFFTPEEIKRNSFLGIILQKLKNRLYENTVQLYLDWQQLTENRQSGNPFRKYLSRWWERFGGLVKILAAAAVIITAVVLTYNSLIRPSSNPDGKAYEPIDHIGTVSIAIKSGSAEETQETG